MKKLFVLVFAIALCLGALCFGASADIQPTKPTEGDGTAADPYKIGTAEELYWFAQQVNSGTTNINAVLTDNITINEDVLNENGELNSGTFREWTPIGTDYNKAYTGTFDGNDKTISGLYYSGSSNYVGLFGYVGSGGRVQNVNVADSYISNSNTRGYTGGVCGRNDGGTITNCRNTGSVTGTNDRAYAGGVCGYNGGTITNCRNTGSVTSSGNGTKYVGGVSGYNGGTITNCYNHGSVSGDSPVGGVCGYNCGTITNCYSTGSVTGRDTSTYVGGVCGRNDGGTIENCYWLSDTTYEADASAKTEAQFASGEVAWLLNQGQANGPWRQTIDTDAFPVLDSTHKVVVKLTVNGTASYLNKGDSFSGVEGIGYYLDGEMVELPYTVEADTVLTTKTLYVVTVDGVVSYVDPNEPVFKLPAAPSRSGYTFVGWSDGNKTYEAGDGVTITADTKFTAVWREINIPDPNSIAVTQPANGTIRVNPSNGSAGTLITVTATPDEGY